MVQILGMGIVQLIRQEHFWNIVFVLSIYCKTNYIIYKSFALSLSLSICLSFDFSITRILLTSSNPAQINAIGVAVGTGGLDLANAAASQRLIGFVCFDSGCAVACF